MLPAEMEKQKTREKDFRNTLAYRILTYNEQVVLELIDKDGPLSGKELCNACDIDESTIRTHIIPNLKTKFPIKNRRTVGYYLDWDIPAQ
jgi:ATP/maltotriose-dependent transcriptional regulator MalT